jgi:outer membrane lipoprotein-sorting protein
MIKTLLAASMVALSSLAIADEMMDKGLKIAQDAKAYDQGFGDFTAQMKMTLNNKHGDVSVRNIRIKTLEVAGDGDKSLSIFDEPADVKGTAMLTWSHGLKADSQWLYLPALKRVKRINSRNKSGPFMGSEFAFEDLSSQEIEKYTYRYLADESCGEMQCYKMERKPAYKYSGYTKQIVWLDKEAFRAVKVDFYDRKGDKLKTLESEGFTQYLGHYYRSNKMTMTNHLNGKFTVLEWKDYAFKTGLTDRDFKSQTLKRSR